MDLNLGADTAGLYAKTTMMEAAKCERDSSKDSGESDFSGDFDEKPGSKKDGKLVVKKKDKDDKDKDKKKDKDKGYAALEGESSQDEPDSMDVKSPFKGKKRSFKFSSSRKEKKKEEEKEKKKEKEKDKEKDKKDKVKEQEASPKDVSRSEEAAKPDKAEEKLKKKEKKDKEKEKEKEPKSKDIKNKLKIKEKKKAKSDDASEDDLPVFGVPLELAIQRSRCHDRVDLPVVVRNCIDYVEEFGLKEEGIYRSSGVKTRVQELRRAYNNRQNVNLKDTEPPIVASLLKQYLRELPDNILTGELLPKFEEAAAIKDSQLQEEQMSALINQLPKYNRILLSWLIVHMEHVIEKERYNKMSIQNLSIVLTPTLNLSPRVLNGLFAHSRTLFADTKITRYIPPLSGVGVRLPEDAAEVQAELEKQESLLAQIHGEMCSVSVGSVSKHREEQLWEAQRIVTQLKRQLKLQVPGTGRSASVREPMGPSEEVVSQAAAQDPNQEEELRLELAVPTAPPTTVEPIAITEVPSAPTVEPAEKDAMDEESTITKLQVGTEDAVDNDKPPNTESDSDKSPSVHVTVIEIGPNAKEESDDQNEVFPEDVSTGIAVLSSVSPKKDELHFPMVTFTEEEELEFRLKIENEEREKLIVQLREAIERERFSIEQLQELIAETGALRLTDSSEEDEIFEISEEQQEQILAEVLRDNRKLEEQNTTLHGKIDEAREACLQLRVQLRVREEKMRRTTMAASSVTCQASH